jgi:hypothetical protein
MLMSTKTQNILMLSEVVIFVVNAPSVHSWVAGELGGACTSANLHYYQQSWNCFTRRTNQLGQNPPIFNRPPN